MRKVDAKKAAQVERLGMGASTSKPGIGHSVMNQMNTIVQVIVLYIKRAIYVTGNFRHGGGGKMLI